MSEGGIEKITYKTHEWHCEFLVMSLGLTNTLATFQSLMNKVFKPCLRKFVLVFFDDILIYSKSIEEQLKHLERVLEILRENEMCANRKKYSFAQSKVEYLSHIMSEQGVEADSEKIKSVSEWPCLTNVREVCGFLGLTGYYKKFVRRYRSITAPLTQLLKNGGFKWTNEAKEAFEKLKKVMMSLPILAIPDFSLPFEIDTDASRDGIGAVLV